MQYTLFIHGSPYTSKACHSALTFAKAIQASSEHELLGVFFYQDSVLIGNSLSQVARDEFNIQTAWQNFNLESNTPLYLCIAAAVSRGIINASESERYELDAFTLASQFQLEGLGTLVDLMRNCDKLITFK